jgi:rhodanese-related sulfurtransferase
MERMHYDADARVQDATSHAADEIRQLKATAQEYATIMNNLALPSPKMMDIAVPSNRALGLSQELGLKAGWGLTAAQDAGLDNVRSIVGGIEAWLEAGGPVEYGAANTQGGTNK